MSKTDTDTLIIGAGLSGVGMACHLRKASPKQRVSILERRQAMGGTWDLFRYPGIRSDSDMCTFGYSFRPWNGTKVLADGQAIREYISDTAKEHGVDKAITYGRRVTEAHWSTEAGRWTVTSVAEDGSDKQTITSKFLINCTGYYNYDSGYAPAFAGEKDFGGQIVHPQHWPEDLDYTGKKVVVIGSGATAITLVPSMADKAGHVTMLQRSPTYVMSVPAVDPVGSRVNRFLPDKLAYRVTRLRNIGLQRLLFSSARNRPAVMKRFLRMAARKQLGDKFDMRHFTPNYAPWDQRLCVVPDGDLFKTLRKGQASIVTDKIKCFDKTGIQLESGEHLDADIIITATGLNIQMFGGAAMTIDGEPVKLSDTMIYRGCMVEGVPNLVTVVGYTNASWTLKADLVSEYTCRLINHMDRKGYGMVVPPRQASGRMEETVMGGLSSGYVQRGADSLPRQGENAPWRTMNDYVRDIPSMRLGRIEDGVLEFRRPVRAVTEIAAKPARGTKTARKPKASRPQSPAAASSTA